MTFPGALELGGPLALLMVVVVVAALCQSLTGFGFALVLVPMMALVWDPKGAVVIATILSTIALLPLLVETYRTARLTDVLLLLIGSFIGTPIGVIVLRAIDVDVLKLVIGCVVLGSSVLTLSVRRRVLSPGGWAAPIVVGAISGVMRASTGMSGPPVVLYLLARRHPPQVMRGTLAAFQVPSSIIALITLGLGGQLVGGHVSLSLLLLPAAVVGFLLGRLLRPMASFATYTRISVVLLALTGIASIVSGLAAR